MSKNSNGRIITDQTPAVTARLDRLVLKTRDAADNLARRHADQAVKPTNKRIEMAVRAGDLYAAAFKSLRAALGLV